MHIPYDGQNFFLSNLLPADFALLEPHLRSLELRVGDYLHRLADDVEDVVFPHSGVVALTLPLQQRTNQEAALLGREGLVGAFAAAALAPATSNAEVRIHGMATRISAQAFRDALAASPRMRRLAAYCDSALMAQMQHSALCNAAHSADARLCRWLLEIHDRSSDKLRLTQATLARMLGVRRTTVTSAAGKLQALGAVQCGRGYVRVANRALLERYSCGCYSHLRGFVKLLFADPCDRSFGRDNAGTRPRTVTEVGERIGHRDRAPRARLQHV
jgi:CRP-like cAMP-binding protein